jgi:hypothetical protein
MVSRDYPSHPSISPVLPFPAPNPSLALGPIWPAGGLLHPLRDRNRRRRPRIGRRDVGLRQRRRIGAEAARSRCKAALTTAAADSGACERPQVQAVAGTGGTGESMCDCSEANARRARAVGSVEQGSYMAGDGQLPPRTRMGVSGDACERATRTGGRVRESSDGSRSHAHTGKARTASRRWIKGQRTQWLARGRRARLLEAGAPAGAAAQGAAHRRACGRQRQRVQGTCSLPQRGNRLQWSSRRVQQGCTKAAGQGPTIPSPR